jgi:glycosyltransferase involved in cell wall biosynthesis
MLENLIVPVLNRYDLLQRMLDSVDVQVDHLLVIDNGTGSDLFFSDKFQNITVLEMPANLGVSGSWNLGIKSFPYAQRWFIISNDVQFKSGALEQLAQARRDEITLTARFPHWQAFVLGDEAVSDIGLFDESLFPAYFEDNDYTRRAEFVEIDVSHENSSTIKAGYQDKNAKTYAANDRYFERKIANNDYTAGSWSLDIRRENGWE